MKAQQKLCLDIACKNSVLVSESNIRDYFEALTSSSQVSNGL